MSRVERWEVKCGASEILLMTIDELDAAFDAGHVDAATLVRQEGTIAWATLAEVAGLDAEARRAPDSLAPAALDATPAPANLDLAVGADFAPPRKPAVIGGVVGVAILAAAAVVLFTRAGGEPAKAAAVAPRPVATAVPAKADAPVDAPEGRVLTEDQKRALAEADRKREAARQLRVQKALGDRPAPRPRRAPEKNPFITGGAPGDPLSN
jgi:hypothetical protein